MRLIFCSDPLDPKVPDPMYAREVDAARSLGIAYSLIHFEALLYEQDAQKAVRRVESSAQEDIGIYRGWMLRPEQYARLYAALAERGIRLLNTPAAYRHCHYLPESYAVIKSCTPVTVWMPLSGAVSMDAIMRLLEPFGAKPILVKDYVKSQKHRWAEACFIPSAADKEAVERVVGRFLQLQGENLNEGLVFREYVEFEPLATHSKSGMPLTKEYRLFYLDGELLLAAPYWEQGDYTDEPLPDEAFSQLALKVQSRFFTMDVARRKDGEYMVVELGDAQVAGLPERADPVDFYQRLKQRLDMTSFFKCMNSESNAIVIQDQGVRLILQMLRRERSGSADLGDANWIVTRIHATAPGFQVDFVETVQLWEIVDLREKLAEMHSTLEGRFEWMAIENFLELGVERDKWGHIHWEVDLIYPAGVGARLSLELENDQTYLPALLNQIDDILDAFPLLGTTTGVRKSNAKSYADMQAEGTRGL